MKVAQETVAAVVSEASKKMSDPNYSASMVGGFVSDQPPAIQFMSAHDSDLGGAEAVVSAVFHCALIRECLHRTDKKTRTLSFDDLDFASQGNPIAKLEKAQPAIADFIASNIENKEAQKLIGLIALALAA